MLFYSPLTMRQVLAAPGLVYLILYQEQESEQYLGCERACQCCLYEINVLNPFYGS